MGGGRRGGGQRGLDSFELGVEVDANFGEQFYLEHLWGLLVPFAKNPGNGAGSAAGWGNWGWEIQRRGRGPLLI